MKSSLLTIAVWVAMSGYWRGSSSCNVSLSTNNAQVDVGSSVILTCQICVGNITTIFHHNGAYIADYTFGTLSWNRSLYQLVYDSGTLVFTLTILQFTTSSSGNYTCSTPSSASLSWIVLAAKTTQASTPVKGAFKCYECNSVTNNGCSDKFTKSSNLEGSSATCMGCSKTKTSGVVTRACLDTSLGNSCKKSGDNAVCYCDSVLCNGSNILAVSMATLLGATLAVFFSKF